MIWRLTQKIEGGYCKDYSLSIYFRLTMIWENQPGVLKKAIFERAKQRSDAPW